ncbi:MAG: HAD hydrolase-like protein [Candidatus Micrarchaeota archaeon]
MVAAGRIVLWDFDGVLADTLGECYEVTRATISQNVARIAAETKAPLAPYPLEEFAGDRPNAVNAADFFAHFLSRRKYGSVGAADLEKTGTECRDLIAFLDGEYYLQRESLAKRLGREYYRMLRPYPGVLDAVTELHGSGVLQAVMTARDSASVQGWLAHYGVRECFQAVVGTEVSRADRHVKGQQAVLLKNQLGAGEYFFVDDIVHNLEVVGAADPAIRLVFAAWGYGKIAPKFAAVAESPRDVLRLLANP